MKNSKFLNAVLPNKILKSPYHFKIEIQIIQIDDVTTFSMTIFFIFRFSSPNYISVTHRYLIIVQQ